MKAFFQFFFLFILFNVSAEAAPYEREIIGIEISHEERPTSFAEGIILLNDGSAWNWEAKCLCCKHKLDLWKFGDKIKIANTGIPEHFLLCNSSHPQYAPFVTLDPDTKETYPVITDIQKDGYALELSDGSSWSVTGWFNLRGITWQIGDRVIVAPQESTWSQSTHVIFNMNRVAKTLMDDSYINVTMIKCPQL